jgi:hypothetical protein
LVWLEPGRSAGPDCRRLRHRLSSRDVQRSQAPILPTRTQHRIVALSALALAFGGLGAAVARYAATAGGAVEIPVAAAPPEPFAAPPPVVIVSEDRISGKVAGLFENMRHSIMLGEVSALPAEATPPAAAVAEAVPPAEAATVTAERQPVASPPVGSAPANLPAVAPAILALATTLSPWDASGPQPPARPAARKGAVALASLETEPAPPKLGRDPLPDLPAPPVRPASLRMPDLQPAIAPEPAPAPVPGDVEAAPQAPALRPPDRSGEGPFKMGSPVYVRIFKKEGQLELWLKRDTGYALFRTYAICKWSGTLGPKLREGDYQSPEGFYQVSSRQLNPHSHYDRAFDVGFPNAFDRRQGYTGNAVMVHGDCKSVGCFAMTNPKIEEIYAYVEAAIKNGQREVPVHIFPFRLTEASLVRETKGDWTSLWSAPHANLGAFWANLKEGYDLFEQTGEPPAAYACGNRYEFGAAGKSCTRIAGW